MKVPQFQPWVGQEEYAAIRECFDLNWITEGPQSTKFAQELLELIGAKYGVFAPNGTLALYLGLRALSIGPGDEVLVPDFTFMGSASAVEMTGATPVFIDVNQENFQVDLDSAAKAITKKTKAIMPVHIYGTMAEMERVQQFAKKYQLLIIEDAAQAIGVRRYGRHAGTFGAVGCFSFFADKTITTAEGGFVVTNSKRLYTRLLFLRNQGRINRGSFIHPQVGYNFRMTDLQTAVGRVQLKKLPQIIERKHQILALYKKHLKNIPEITFFRPPQGSDWIPFRVGISYPYATELMDYLRQKEIETRTYFYPLHRQPAFAYLKKHRTYHDKDFPGAVAGYNYGICLPTFPLLSTEQIKHICRSIKEFIKIKRQPFYHYYDTIYGQKDYQSETEQTLALARELLHRKPTKVLEVGCGTGSHTLQLAKHIPHLVSIDIDPSMVKIAQKKIKNQNNVSLLYSSVEKLAADQFDLVLALFNVVTYIPTMTKLISFFASIASRLTPGGVFLFDCWNGIAAIADPPRNRNISLVSNGKKIDCKQTATTNLISQHTRLAYDLVVTSESKKEPEEHGYLSFNQTLWTPMQIRSALKSAGLSVVRDCTWKNLTIPASSSDRQIIFCCLKKP